MVGRIYYICMHYMVILYLDNSTDYNVPYNLTVIINNFWIYSFINNNNYYYYRTYGILGIIGFVSTIVTFPFIKERDPSDRINKLERVKNKGIVDWNILKNVNMLLWIFVGPIQLIAGYISFIFIPCKLLIYLWSH